MIEETVDLLAGDWKIVQLARGHRWATDDLVTAWTARGAAPGARRLLDLGCGVGSIGLLALMFAPPDARLVSVEVQGVSVALLRKTLALNGLEQRVEVVHRDLRELDCAERQFELITANPPYLPPDSATASPHPQRAAARLELHGDVFDYCAVAARALAPDGRFVFCHAARDDRPEQAVARAGLRVLARRDVVFRAGQPPLIAVFTCAHTGERADAPPLLVRGADGAWTAEHLAIRRAMKIDP